PAAKPPAESTDPGALAARIRQLEVRVARLERRCTEDLAAPGMLAVRGVWRIDGGHIVSPDDPVALLQLPRNPPEEYILSMRVRRISGINTFAIGIPVGARQVLVALDAHASTVSGLERLDGRFVHENEATKRGSLFVPEMESTVTVTVRKDRITCAFDDVTVVDYRGDPERLSLPETFAVPDSRALFLATLGSRYAVSDMALSPVTRSAAAADQGDTTAPQIKAPRSAARLAQFRARWKLQLLPEVVPEIGPLLVGTAWEQRGRRDILGRGTDQFIRFPFPSAKHGPLEILFKTVVHHSANTHIRTTDTTKTYPLAIDGTILEYNGLIHTAFVSKEKKFIPDAVIRVGDRKWYTASSRSLVPAEGGAESIEMTERLFEFDDDPVKQRNGRLTLHQHVRKMDEPAGEITHTPTNFALFRHSGDDSQPYEVQIGTPSSRSVTVFFYAGQDYALMEEYHRHGTGIYEK
ncbi:MAG: hypothetical protein HY290_19335, partial [Planctomycetia bacterium]|nr:hypothetical protein [Planctomycetia bacterium]